jgi:hypothetical protein
MSGQRRAPRYYEDPYAVHHEPPLQPLPRKPAWRSRAALQDDVLVVIAVLVALAAVLAVASMTIAIQARSDTVPAARQQVDREIARLDCRFVQDHGGDGVIITCVPAPGGKR